MKKIIISYVLISLSAISGAQQIDAGLFRFPDVSHTQIVFTYANDIWIMPKTGGTAQKLSSPAGLEVFPKFSPDGKTVAFSANYDGNNEIYTLPVTGGVPERLTYHGFTERVIDWTPDGKNVLFGSGRESGRNRFGQLFTIPAKKGAATKLPFAYAEFGSYSPDGTKMALVFVSQAFRNWKRYRGGWKANIHIYDFVKNTSQNISKNEVAGSEFPMWNGDYIYFLSDRGAEQRMNLWRYSLGSEKLEQLTKFTEYDIHFPSSGPDDIVFEQGGKLYLFSFATQKCQSVNVSLVMDKTDLKPKNVSAEKYVQHFSISPDGNRLLAEARGDIFSLPAENGFVKNITQSPGFAERYPAWSPNGKQLAYWSDEGGEYNLWIKENDLAPKKITNFTSGFNYSLYWSPDSKMLAFIDKAMKIKYCDVATGKTYDIDKALYFMHGACEAFILSWSPDSRWIAYTRDLSNFHKAAFIYDTKNKTTKQVTSGYYNIGDLVFDEQGKYLLLTTNQAFNPYYSDLDNSFVYGNSTQLAAISLKNSDKSLLYTQNDTVDIKLNDKNEGKKEEGKEDKKKDSVKSKNDISAKEKDKVDVTIDFDGLESRMVILPVAAGNYANLSAVKGKIIYQKYPNLGSPDDAKPALKYYDIEDRKEKNISENIESYQLSANGEKILVKRGNSYSVIKPSENQKMEKMIRLNEMEMKVDPAMEWKQIFTDAWRLERDYFYDPNMHGVNWNQVKERYEIMLKDAVTREEVDFIIGEMIGELNASHTYHGGGDMERSPVKPVGYLGINWEADGNFFKIKKIIRGASWDASLKSPLDEPGIGIKEGDYILAVNGMPITTETEPYANFQGLDKKTVELTYNTKPEFAGAKTVVVETIANEYNLRYMAWVEDNRRYVAKATNGEVGYIYVQSTGTDGQEDLLRQLNAQWDKKALIIDERFNSGGQIPDRFIEQLNRTPLAYWATRDGEPWPWPPFAHFGPKVMLINGWSGSGGDAFPDFFRKKNLGLLIGTRTWGGLIGISGVPNLIDGGSITAPTFRMYNQDGKWFREGHGVDPDIEVDENLAEMAKGNDVQLDRAITEIKNALKNKGYNAPVTPAYEKRN
ncbi:MAG: PD40 domain-containing protein [Chitinophagaceae bacterium]|nr:PD40 domain-containing protein [Chitinophagaceae bacterium]MBP6046418.1 PD40 domain-containing protein [Ferruginibacter sp.]MBK7089532.1 PD40 domain-containing protein [Chitinophagaceae bacterium]MBK7347258.1 PD40 domain-containing protein [Chitinophagaceae bacterium]MBK8929029.1 PD40 domain-containing protein [Chitinophagaceae bacterium]